MSNPYKGLVTDADKVAALHVKPPAPSTEPRWPSHHRPRADAPNTSPNYIVGYPRSPNFPTLAEAERRRRLRNRERLAFIIAVTPAALALGVILWVLTH